MLLARWVEMMRDEVVWHFGVGVKSSVEVCYSNSEHRFWKNPLTSWIENRFWGVLTFLAQNPLGGKSGSTSHSVLSVIWNLRYVGGTSCTYRPVRKTGTTHPGWRDCEAPQTYSSESGMQDAWYSSYALGINKIYILQYMYYSTLTTCKMYLSAK